MHSIGGTGGSAYRLADAEEVALAVPEPGALLADAEAALADWNTTKKVFPQR
jgi:hypothetical protein